jgi:hypothetical protein
VSTSHFVEHATPNLDDLASVLLSLLTVAVDVINVERDSARAASLGAAIGQAPAADWHVDMMSRRRSVGTRHCECGNAEVTSFCGASERSVGDSIECIDGLETAALHRMGHACQGALIAGDGRSTSVCAMRYVYSERVVARHTHSQNARRLL